MPSLAFAAFTFHSLHSSDAAVCLMAFLCLAIKVLSFVAPNEKI